MLSQLPSPAGLKLNIQGHIFWYYGFLGLPVSLIGWFLASSIYSFLATLFWGKTNARGMMCALGFSILPTVFSAPLNIIGNGLGWGVLMVIANLFILAWVVVLQVIALRESLDIETGQAVALWITPPAVIFVIMIMALIGLAGMFSTII